MLRQLYSEISSCRKCFDDVEIGSKISSLDKFMFLPPRLENGVPKYVFITMEPTDTWCNSREHGEKLLSDGMVNFITQKICEIVEGRLYFNLSPNPYFATMVIRIL
jgi:hypothetical protein